MAPATEALRLGAACRRAREALGAGGVAAAAFAVARPWRAEPEASLRLWRARGQNGDADGDGDAGGVVVVVVVVVMVVVMGDVVMGDGEW